MSTKSDRAQANFGSAKQAVLLVVTLMVAAVVGAVLAPVAINAIEGDETTTLTQDEDTTYEVNGALESKVTTINVGSNATVQLNDTRTSGTTSKTISEGSTVQYSLQGGTVNVTLDNTSSGTPKTSTVTYEYSKDYAFSSGAASLWNILGLAIVLGLFLLVLGRALRYT